MHVTAFLPPGSMMDFYTPRYAPSEAVTLLQEAQCGNAASAAATLHNLALHLRTPHPTITAAALDLLQVHPSPTIPHIASLISASSADVHAAVEAFSDLLSADRTLLVPIIAALSDLRLSSQHQLQTRATLRFALQVVDAHDLPAVVRAVARMSASAASVTSARWAARSLRVALADPPKADIIPVLAHVLEDVCRPGNVVGYALRGAAGEARVIWLDLVVWLHALRSRAGPHAEPFRQAARTVLAAVHSTLLAGDLPSLLAAVAAARPALEEAGEAVHVFVRLVAESLQSGGELEESARFARLVRALVDACPRTGAGILAELVSPELGRGCSSEAAVMALLEVLPARARRPVSMCGNARLRVAVLMQEAREVGDGAASSVWSDVFVEVRKGFLFGVEGERRQAMDMAREIAHCAGAETVRELIAITDASVAEGLGDELAMGFLVLIGVATVRGLITAEVAAKILTKRIDRQGLHDLVREQRVSGSGHEMGAASTALGASSVHASTTSLQVDAGMARDQDPASVATVTSCAAALSLACTSSDLESVSVGLLNVNVLVPVVCIPLYQAVEECDKDFFLLSMRADTKHRAESMREWNRDSQHSRAVSDIDVNELAIAVSSFAAGMASIVGILNLSCVSLSLSQRIPLGLRSCTVQVITSEDQRTMWSLLERLTEFDRMFSALLLGDDLIQRKSGPPNVSSNNNRADPRRRERERRAAKEVNDAKCLILKSLSMTTDSHETELQQDGKQEPNFPRLSLGATVCALAAVPDDPSISDLQKACRSQQERDFELARIESFLICQLSRYMLASGMESTARRREAQRDFDKFFGDSPVSGATNDTNAFDEQKLDDASFLKSIDAELETKDDIFFVDGSEDESNSDSDMSGIEQAGVAAVRWATVVENLKDGDSENSFSGAALLPQRKATTRSTVTQSVEIIHSGAFAALLLDRAATYVVASRISRLLGRKDHELACSASTAGLFISCFVAVLRNKSSSLSDCAEWRSCEQYGKGDVSWFLKKVDENLCSGFGQAESSICDKWDWHVDGDGAKALNALHWISQSSIDSGVAAVALQGLLIIAELGGLHMRLARQAVLSSLTTVYEYESESLWSANEVHVLTSQSFGDWCARRRGLSGGRRFELPQTVSRANEKAPWTFVHLRNSRKISRTKRHRVEMYFAGMCVAHALQEGRGWVRELGAVLFTRVEDGDGASSRAPAKNLFRAQASRGMDCVASAEDLAFTRCEALLDVVGFRSVMETLLLLVQVGLEAYCLPDNFSVQDAVELEASPLQHIEKAMNLMRGIIDLYVRTLLSPVEGERAQDTVGEKYVDAELEHVVVSSTIGNLQMIRSHLDAICSWYLNPGTDVSTLTTQAVTSIEQVVGSSSDVVSQSVNMSAIIKERYRSYADGTQANRKRAAGNETPSKRKSPAFATPRRTRAVGTRDEDVSKARKLIPRLSSQCESVTKEAQKLAKAMGIRAVRKLAKLGPPPPSADSTVHIGFALRTCELDRGFEADMHAVEHLPTRETSSDGVHAHTNTDDSVDEFRARTRGRDTSAELEPETVTIHFKT